MPTVSRGVHPVAGRSLDRLPPYLPAAAVAAVALAARLAPVLRGGGLTGVLAYDDGVYYASSDALLSGRLPYRDYVLLHPPGITLVLAPFAALGRLAGDPVGFATGRVAFMLLGVLNAVLVMLVARRVSPRAGVLAGLAYAVWQPAAYAERTTLLEPLVNLGLLAALVLLRPEASRLRVAAAGVALGLAVAVKAWAVVPLVVLAVWLWRREGPRSAGTYVASAATAAAAVCLPFLVAAGWPMVRMVLLDQLRRPSNGVSPAARLSSIESLQVSPNPLTASQAAAVVAIAVGAAALALVVAWRRPPARVWVVLLAVQTALLLGSHPYFAHYATFVAPALALLAGTGADGALGWLSGRLPARLPALRAVAPATGLVLVALLAAHVVTRPEGYRVPGQTVAAELAGVRCVAADSAEALVTSGSLTRDLRDGCPVLVDVTGLSYDQGGHLRPGATPAARRHDRRWQRAVGQYFAGAGAVLLDQWHSDGLPATLLRALERHDVPHGGPGYRVLLRRS